MILTREQAARTAVRAQLLAAPQPTDLLDVVRHLTLLQDDQTQAVVRSAELVLWSRLGDHYDLGDLQDELDAGRLVEIGGYLRPREDVALYTAEMASWPSTTELKGWGTRRAEWVEANEQCRLDVLERLRMDGPTAARDLPDTCEVPWRSSGWNNNKNVQRLVDLMVLRGEVASAGRDGADRLWDLAERVYPDDPPVPLADALRIRDERQLRSLGLARRAVVGDAGVEARVEGVRGTWQLDPTYLEDESFEGRTVLLSPLDRLVFDRKRMTELFGFDYQLEMYKPAAQRKWGYWALPVLRDDQLIGKVDATADRREGVLHVDAVHRDGPWSKGTARAVDEQVEALASWLGLRCGLR